MDQLQRYIRIIRTFMRHAGLNKVANVVSIEAALARGKMPSEASSPYTLIVDLFNTCNLHCPLCTTGCGKILPRENRMSIDNYRMLIEPLKKNLFGIFLYNWSEPFLNPDIYDIIRHTADCNVATFVSSNLSLHIDADALVRSGLDHLIISGDGITQEVYEQYRRGGNLSRVLENLKNIAAAKKALHSKTPTIEWQCLVNRFNEHQMDVIRTTVRAAGANEVRFANLNFFSSDSPADDRAHWLPKSPAWRHYDLAEPPESGAKRRPCHWLWRSAVVNCNGTVSPCCLYDIEGWGNAIDRPFPEVWHGPIYAQARSLSYFGESCEGAASTCGTCMAPFIRMP